MTLSDFASHLPALSARMPALSARMPSQRQLARMFARTHRSPSEYATVFTLGLIVGAAAALLNATKPGKELRQDIAKRATKLRDKARERIGTNGHGRQTQADARL